MREHVQKIFLLFLLLPLSLSTGCSAVIHHRGYLVDDEQFDDKFVFSGQHYSQRKLPVSRGRMSVASRDYVEKVKTWGPLLPIIPISISVGLQPDSGPVRPDSVIIDIVIQAEESLDIWWDQVVVVIKGGSPVEIARSQWKQNKPRSSRGVYTDGMTLGFAYPPGVEPGTPFEVRMPVFFAGRKAVQPFSFQMTVKDGNHYVMGPFM